jgi:tetratricopeptide (TPR) repeat protein
MPRRLWPIHPPLPLLPLLGLLAWATSIGPVNAHPGIHEQEREAEAALAAGPRDPEAHLHRGRLYAERREWDAALESYEQARRLGADPNAVDLLAGAVFLEAGWFRMAKARFEAVLERDPERHDARFGRARAWMGLDHPKEASSDFALALAKMPEPQPAYILERRDALLAIGEREDALGALEEGMTRIGRVPTLELAAVDLEVSLGRHDAALRRMDSLLDASPGQPLWMARRAEILEQAGRTEEARAAYVNALGLVQARSARSGSRRFAELETELRQAVQRIPEDQRTEVRP